MAGRVNKPDELDTSECVSEVKVSSQDGSDHGADKLTDGDDGTYWGTAHGTPPPHWVRMWMRQYVSVRHISVRVGGGYLDDLPRVMELWGGDTVNDMRRVNTVPVSKDKDKHWVNLLDDDRVNVTPGQRGWNVWEVRVTEVHVKGWRCGMRGLRVTGNDVRQVTPPPSEKVRELERKTKEQEINLKKIAQENEALKEENHSLQININEKGKRIQEFEETVGELERKTKQQEEIWKRRCEEEILKRNERIQVLEHNLKEKTRENNSNLNVQGKKIHQLEEELARMAMRTEPAQTCIPTYALSERRPLGYCVIINNQQFQDFQQGVPVPNKHKDRHGSKPDADQLDRVFSNFGFNIVRLTNLKREEIEQQFIKYSEVDHSSYSMFIMCVLSHGTRNAVYGVDGGEALQLNRMLEMYTGDACKSLNSKPKIFFVQTCQGGDRSVDSDAGPGHKLEKFSYHLPDQHMLLGYSTLPNKVSVRDREGTWYIQELCSQLEQDGDRLELTSLLTKVQHQVAQRYGFIPDGQQRLFYVKQHPFIMSSLTKGIIFERRKP